MGWLNQLFMRRQIYRDLSEEIQQHLAEKVEAMVAGGMSVEEATHAAKREFGNATALAEEGREVWMWTRVESLLSDARYAIRRLRESPGFALTAITTLALGIGANVAILSVVNGLFLRPLDVPRAGNVFEIDRTGGPSGQSWRDYLDYRDRDHSFSGMVAYQFQRVGITIGKAPAVRSWGYDVSGNYFDVLGLQPALGHFFHGSDEHGPASAPWIVLSHDFWRRQFNSNPRAVGKTILLNQHPFTVIGVARPGFHGTEPFFAADYWFPLVNAAQVTGVDSLPYRDHLSFTVLGRLKPGMTADQAMHNLNRLAKQMAKEDPKDEGLTLQVRRPGPGADERNPSRKVAVAIALLAALVLLAACANLASIFAARAADRSSELAIRLAIGSSRWRVLRQLLTEATMVSIVGGVVGSFAAWLLLKQLSHFQAFADFPTHFFILPDARVYAIALVLSIASGILFGITPARQVWRTDVAHAMLSGFLETKAFGRFAVRDVLLVVQIAVCTLSLTASLVAVRGMMRALDMPLGIQPKGVVLAEGDLRMAGYSGEQALPVQRRILEAAAGIPGVTAAAVSDGAPFLGHAGWFVYRWGTTEFLFAHWAFGAWSYMVAPGYFRTAGTRLVQGRDFTWHDDRKSPRVAVVNQTFARKLYGTEAAVGRRFALWATAKYEVVGVVKDGKYGSIGEDPTPAMFIPLAQGYGDIMATNATVLVRSALPPDQIGGALQRKLSEIEPGVPFKLQSWDDVIDSSMMFARIAAAMLGVMALTAAMLAATGVFGMASYSVSRRMKEQGIRMALGAEPGQVMFSVLRRPLMLLIGGSSIGLAAGVATSLLAHLASFATPRDPLVLMGVVLAMTLLGLVATWGPARRVLSVDAARLLRE